MPSRRITQEYIQTQKGQGILLTLAANSVIDRKKSPDYWEIEKKWIAGEYVDIVEKRMAEIKHNLNM